MRKDEFMQKLQELGLNKREFAELSELAYSTVNNWNDTSTPIPKWVSSWLENYAKATKYEKIKDLLKDI
ncbi:XRE family transcriptional regulator [Helicobacter cappadocius]|uniref:XRE family transcriptional regulator n=1 Tax=Helicobacter cappadocius TaxID=3063998 RepID=A0AA90TAA6_9HELI|nr:MULTISPECIES: XRE family transcriptional regulator [unclassified Helicobacter]MDO7253876.1 XRE family transcriptional regulator [Helicobacter sp. faydin-H75]MDP2539737.1 XRE family transcriptional regulator [Helicobacter sp. faydin-H76]